MKTNALNGLKKTRTFIQKNIYISLFVLLFFAAPLSAEIYWYVDKEGILHFTDDPLTANYQPYFGKDTDAPVKLSSSNKYDNYIFLASKKHGIAVPLLKALIKVESNFNQWAISRKGASGLMQIMPYNFKDLNIKDPFNPKENILGGSLYFKQLMKRFKGQLPLALAAYNAGPNAVARFRSVPPYQETKNYVKRVMKYYRIFKNNNL